MKKQKENFRSSVLHELQKHVIKLEYDHDDLKQYGCCFCMRSEDILAEKDETADKVFSKAENILNKACPNLSGDCIDRAHRIKKTNKTCHSVIVCFTSFKHRTSTYQNRNILKDVRVKLDLTKKKYISKSVRSIADEKQDAMSLQILIAD